jgi:hypothetical protein
MILNEQGNKRMMILSASTFLAFILSIFFTIGDPEYIFVVPAMYGAILYWYLSDLKTGLRKQLLYNIYKKLNFKRSGGQYSKFENYKITENRNFIITSSWKGIINNQQINFIEFDVNTGFKQRDWEYPFIGAEIITAKPNIPMQIYNRRNPLMPWFKKGIVLESVDFHKHFKVIADKDITAFKQLSPSVMNELLILSDTEKIPLNIEFTKNKILVYTYRKNFEKILSKIISFREMLNGIMDEGDQEVYEESILQLHKICQVGFKALELQAMKPAPKQNKKSST